MLHDILKAQDVHAAKFKNNWVIWVYLSLFVLVAVWLISNIFSKSFYLSPIFLIVFIISAAMFAPIAIRNSRRKNRPFENMIELCLICGLLPAVVASAITDPAYILHHPWGLSAVVGSIVVYLAAIGITRKQKSIGSKTSQTVR